jgi:S-DNA-T family DNA segregation ATPase FtsK/SpoIIIE
MSWSSLSDDIALTMKATSVRIVAPIPGKNRVGVEVPNSQITTVYLKEVLSSDEFRKSKSKLTLAIGKDTAGKPIVADLGEMPHLLIAGTTGSGKTVCVNSIIMSMLFNATPNDVKFLMIDPKMVELAPYNNLPHMLCPVVTDPKKVATALAWVTAEMDERYQLLAKEGVRNIEAYNQRKQKLPYIIVVIDELADLMMVVRDQVESAIARLAQLSRAVGIHLLLATQRPSVDVITGVIKANFPARISFKVASKTDSRTVLDMNGADKLLGRGDLLFLQPGQPKPVRAQSSYMKDSEIDNVLQFIKKQAHPVYDESILKQQEQALLGGISGKDELYETAAKLIIETGQASVSILQRRLRLGYTRAARLIDMMQEEGLVGPYRGSKPRDILIDREQWLKDQMKKGVSEDVGK